MSYASAAAALLAVVSIAAHSGQPTFRDRYNDVAKEMVPLLQTTGCETKQASAGKAITECKLQASNALLSLDSVNNKLSGVWLLVDSTQLAHPSDIVRAGGLLLRTARGASYGNYLAVATDVMDASRKQGWKEACKDDAASASRFCVSANARQVFSITLTPL